MFNLRNTILSVVFSSILFIALSDGAVVAAVCTASQSFGAIISPYCYDGSTCIPCGGGSYPTGCINGNFTAACCASEASAAPCPY